MASLQDTNPENLKILAVTCDNNLVCYGCAHPSPKKEHLIFKNILCEPALCCSISPVIGNRYIFLVGGVKHDDKLAGRPSASPDVFFIDRQGSNVKTSGPSLLGPKCCPTLIVMGSILFAVSHLICEADPPTVFASKFTFEYLDTSVESRPWEWQPLSPFPFSEFTSKYDAFFRLLAYVADESTKTLYLCLRGVSEDYDHAAFTLGTRCITYNLNPGLDKWVIDAHEPLPFNGEGKVFNNLFYGFPPGPPGHPYSLLGEYRLESRNWVMQRQFPIFSHIKNLFSAHFPSLYFPSEDVIAIVRARDPNICGDDNPHVLDFEVVGLPKMRARDQAGSIKTQVNIISRSEVSSSWRSQHFYAVLGVFSDRLCW